MQSGLMDSIVGVLGRPGGKFRKIQVIKAAVVLNHFTIKFF